MTGLNGVESPGGAGGHADAGCSTTALKSPGVRGEGGTPVLMPKTTWAGPTGPHSEEQRSHRPQQLTTKRKQGSQSLYPASW